MAPTLKVSPWLGVFETFAQSLPPTIGTEYVLSCLRCLSNTADDSSSDQIHHLRVASSMVVMAIEV